MKVREEIIRECDDQGSEKNIAAERVMWMKLEKAREWDKNEEKRGRKGERENVLNEKEENVLTEENNK